MTQNWLDSVPLWGAFALSTALALLALESGYRLGRWRKQRGADEKDGPTGAMVGAVLGLLAFMLAFTFSLSASRFDARRQVVLEEANAVGTTYLRAGLIPEPERSEVESLLREYVNARINAVQQNKVTEAVTRSEEIHTQLWTRAATAAERNPGSIITALFIQSLNDVIDLHAKRLQVATRSRIPPSIWGVLLGLAAVGMAAMGYQAGLSGTRRSLPMLFLAMAFAGVLFLIVDLDRAHDGLLRVSQQAMIDLQKNMSAP
jgi:hypothetical protein